MTLFAARESRPVNLSSPKTLRLGLQVGVATMELLANHTYHMEMGDFRVRNCLNTSLVSPSITYIIFVYAV